MFQIPQNTGFSDSMSSVSQGVPKITNMVGSLFPLNKRILIYLDCNDLKMFY